MIQAGLQIPATPYFLHVLLRLHGFSLWSVCGSIPFLIMDAMFAQVFLFLACLLSQTQGLNNGLGLSPPMGWNSWNYYHCNVTDKDLRKQADAIISKGLDKYGYQYVNVDDCWASSRDKHGNIVPDHKKFPNMTDLVEYIHSKGLLFGIYSDAGRHTCAGTPGSLGYETNDANMYAKWRVDYLKYDNCDSDGTRPEERYPVMRDALNKTGRSIFFSMCEWGVDDPATWGRDVGNSWRTTLDIEDNWESMVSRADQNNKWWKYAGPGGWNDPDMFEIGNGGMSTTEYETHFSLWCLMKAPLLLGCNIDEMNAETKTILTNDEVIAVNQDSLGVQGNKTKVMGTNEIWAGPLSDGSKAVILLNRGSRTSNITAEWSDIGWSNKAKATVRDLWAHKDIGTKTGKVTASVPSHGVVMYRIKPVKH